MTRSAGPARALNCVVVNVNGLRRHGKRRDLFAALMGSHYDVVVLCETHCVSDAEGTQWLQRGAGMGRPWTGHACWSHGTSQSRGVGVLVRSTVTQVAPRVVHRDAEGRLLLVGFRDASGNAWEVLATYAPVEVANRAAFFTGPFAQACACHSAPAQLLVAGDLNCVTDPLDFMDVQGAAEGPNSRLVGGQQLLQVMGQGGLVDVWRQAHPGQAAYTRYTTSQQGVSAGRTTRWLVGQGLGEAGWQLDCDIKPQGHLPGDHAPVRLTLTAPRAPIMGEGHWRFPLYLLAVPEYVEAARAHIQAEVTRLQGLPGSTAVSVWEGVKLSVKHFTLNFSWRRARDRRRPQQLLQRAVRVAQQRVQQAPQDPAAVQGLRDAVAALAQAGATEGRQAEVALGALWERYGEQGTAWFHRLGKPTPDQHPILEVRDPAGGEAAQLHTVEGIGLAKDRLADYFDGDRPGGLFHPGAPDVGAQDQLLGSLQGVLSPDAQRACLGPCEDGRLTLGCLQDALQQCPAGKAPGSDGLPYEWYRAFWEVVAGPLLAAFNEPFLSAAAQPQLGWSARLGLIVLLYKMGGKPRDDTDSYRPLTLLNSDVKLVAKVMAGRFGIPLDSVIDASQTAFVPGRWIGDNVLEHLEAVEYYPAAQESACIVGLDFAKAYDRIDRGWLGRCMEALGLPAPARRWVSLLLEGTRAVVTFNGHSSRAFQVRRGCAQGSPLSPLLYVMSAQPLAARCRQLVQVGRVAPRLMPGTGGPASPVQQHADDTTLHARSVEGAGVLMQEAVQPFCAASTAEVSLPKCWGLALGAHPPLQGLHEGTGVVFKAPGEAVRHLGVPLVVGDPKPAVMQLFQRKVQAIQARIRHWRQFDVTVMGRAHVAKQVLASVVSYHAMFLPVPQEAMEAMQRLIKGYVWGNCVEEEQVGARDRVWLGTTYATLPKGMGGIGLVNLPAYVQALQAKVAAMLLHPKVVPWKLYARHALEQQFPGLGLAALVQGPAWPRAPAWLSWRQQGFARAFKDLPLVRGVRHGDMSPQQIRRESLLGNASVAGEDGLGRERAADLPAEVRQYHRLGQVPGEQLGLFKLPPSWSAQLQCPDAEGWELEIGGRFVRRWRALEQGGGHEVRPVLTSGLVGDPLRLVPAAPGVWRTACVVEVPHPKRPREKQQWVVGAWPTVAVDPSVWAVGARPVLQYTVRDATQARVVPVRGGLREGELAGRGRRPKVWGLTPPGGLAAPAEPGALQALHERQVQRFTAAQAQAGSSNRRRRMDPGPDAYDTLWMHPSPERMPVRQRVLGLAQQQAAAALQHHLQLQQITQPLIDDSAWEVAPVPPWAGAWRRAVHPRLPRDTQVFAWRLLHANLALGGRRVITLAPAAPELEDCLCAAPACVTLQARPLETLAHLYGECLVGKAAALWLCRIWGRIDPGGHQLPPVPDLRTLIADDAAVWSPGPGLYPLWTLLRLTMLKCVWQVRGAARMGKGRYTFAAVAGAFIAEITTLIRQDWACVEGDVRVAAGVPPSWFRGREPRISVARFVGDWCVGGVLAAVITEPGDRRRMEVRLKPDRAVQLPPRGED